MNRPHSREDLAAALADLTDLVRREGPVGLLRSRTENPLVQFLRYGITAFSTFLVDFLLFVLGTAGVHYLPAAAFSFCVGITCNFLLTKFFAFRAVHASVGPAGELGLLVTISGVGLLLTMGLMFLFTSKLHLYFMVSKLLSSFLVFFWNFFGRKLILYPGHPWHH